MGAWFRNLSLATKMTGVIMATSGVALLLASAAVIAYDVATARVRLTRDVGMLADLIGANSIAAIAFNDARAATDTLRSAGVNEHITTAAIVRNGAVFARYDRDPRTEYVPIVARVDASWFAGSQEFSQFDTGVLRLVHPITFDGEVVGSVYLESDLGDLADRLARFAGIIVLVLAGTCTVALVLSWRLQRVILAPILQLTAVTRAFSRDGDYAIRARKTSHDEVGVLIDGVNEMLAEIGQRDKLLLRHQEELEHTVELRTAALVAANTELATARDRAMEGSRAKSKFLANMSHEIRTPMNGIMGMTQLALDSPLAPDQRDWLETVKSSAASLLNILNDILDFSKIESRKLTLERVPFSVRDVVNDTLKALAPTAHQKGLALVADVAADVPAAITGDPGRIGQVLTNLVGNAIKFTEQGHVRIEVRREGERANGMIGLRFAVIDTGIGIPGDKHATIFESFSQADGSITRRFGGTGLGLTISLTLVHMMGGRLWVESEPGRGSTFQFTADFPLSAMPAVPNDGFLAGLGTPRRVLVVEDHIVNQRVAVGMLTRRGHTVEIANNGLEAVEAVTRSHFDVVLMDLQMPHMGGLEATRTIRALEAGTGWRSRIVAMTAHAMKGDREQCLAAGMDAYLAKPIDRESLFAAVEEGDEVTPRAPSPGSFDLDDLRDRLDGNDDLIAEIVGLFLEDCPARLAEIGTAVASRDRGRIRTAAHSLKGAAGSLSATALVQCADALETAAQGDSDDDDALDAAWHRLNHESERLTIALEAFSQPLNCRTHEDTDRRR